ncbi:MAG: hypothetical protein H7836_00355 [Magnetococcus sp. YQC-3]
MKESLVGKLPAEQENGLSLADLLAHFRMVGKVSLYTALATAICLLVVLYLLAGVGGESYLAIFDAHLLTRKQLGPVLLVSGLVLVTITAVITWIVVVYSTFRVAGPLYTLSQALDGLILDGSAMIRNRRSTDGLSDEHLRFSGGAKRLQFHYDCMHELVERALVQLAEQSPSSGEELTETINQLREFDRHVTL